MLRILQISDPHFGPLSHWPQAEPEAVAEELSSEIRAALKESAGSELPSTYDVVLLSGDFTWGAPVSGYPRSYETGFETARLFIRKLIDDRLAQSAESVVLIPGNHDIRWAQPGHNGDFQFQSRADAEYHYRKLVEEALPELKGKEPGTHLQLQTHLGHIHVFHDLLCDFVLLALNSTRIESADHAGIGYVGADQIHGLLRQLEDIRAERNCRLVVALHHHLQPIESVRLRQMLLPKAERRHSFVTDGFDVLTTLLELQADVILHGHMHVPHHCFHGLMPVESAPLSTTALASAGSVGLGAASGNISGVHHFQVIELTELALRLHSFEAPLGNARDRRNWRKQTLQLDFKTAAQPLSRLRNQSTSEGTTRSSHELALFESELELEAWARGDARARESIRGKIREEKLKPHVRKAVDEAFAYAEGELANKKFIADYRKAFEEDNPITLGRCVEKKMNQWEPGR